MNSQPEISSFTCSGGWRSATVWAEGERDRAIRKEVEAEVHCRHWASVWRHAPLATVGNTLDILPRWALSFVMIWWLCDSLLSQEVGAFYLPGVAPTEYLDVGALRTCWRFCDLICIMIFIIYNDIYSPQQVSSKVVCNQTVPSAEAEKETLPAVYMIFSTGHLKKQAFLWFSFSFFPRNFKELRHEGQQSRAESQQVNFSPGPSSFQLERTGLQAKNINHAAVSNTWKWRNMIEKTWAS